MTDPNVIEAVRKLAKAVRQLVIRQGGATFDETMPWLREADALLAAEKTPEAIGNTCPDCGRHKAGDVEDLAIGSCPKWYATHDRSAEADCVKHQKPPVVPPLPWELRSRLTGQVIAQFRHRHDAESMKEDDCEVIEAPAAPAIVPVRFNEDASAICADGSEAYAPEDGWEANLARDHANPMKLSYLRLSVKLRPGEDAGVTTAKILAACGRGP